jgi:outer membrane receptor protein involved in Fe transport
LDLSPDGGVRGVKGGHSGSPSCCWIHGCDKAARTDLTRADRSFTGLQDDYTIVDLAFGLNRDSYAVEVYLGNAFDERAQTGTAVTCATFACGGNPYYFTNQPRTFGVRFSQEF